MRSIDLNIKLVYTDRDNERKGDVFMQEITIRIPEYLFAFYKKVGEQAGGLAVEKVIEDTLFKLAGELSMNVISEKQKYNHKRFEIQ